MNNNVPNIYSLFMCYLSERLQERAAERAALLDVESELQKMIDLDPTGDGFIYDMFMYKLKEFNYGKSTEEIKNALCMPAILENLGLTVNDITSNRALYNGLDAALHVFTEKTAGAERKEY